MYYDISLVEHLSYIGLFLSVGFSGYAIPIPEEILLVLGGFLAAGHIASLSKVILVSFLGAVFGDIVIYYLSGHGSRFAARHRHRMHGTLFGWYLRHVEENPARTIFLSRFIIGMRFLNPLVAGLLKIDWRIFVPAAAASAALYVPAVVLLGYYFHNQIHMVIRILESVRHYIILSLIVLTIIFVILFFKNLIQKESKV